EQNDHTHKRLLSIFHQSLLSDATPPVLPDSGQKCPLRLITAAFLHGDSRLGVQPLVWVTNCTPHASPKSIPLALGDLVPQSINVAERAR
ncbi:MAG TPA: hypothetical protein VF852_18000, partial [Pseudolabrys sp.]